MLAYAGLTDVASLLLVTAEGEERRTEHVEPDDGNELGCAGGSELAIDDDLLGGGPPAASERRRPRPPDVPRLVQLPLPLAECRDPGVEIVGQGLGVGALLVEEGTHLVAKPLLLRVECQPHRREPGRVRAALPSVGRGDPEVTSVDMCSGSSAVTQY